MDLTTRLLLLKSRTRVLAPARASSPSNPYQVPYEPFSSVKDVNVMVPAHLKDPMRRAMERVVADYGDVDAFVARELHYNSVSQMHQCFMGLQVDAVALAIWQIQKGKAAILADATGVGKGRVAAAIVRWTILNKMLPIFCTYSDTLFTDFHRDLDDIGSGPGVWPLLFNAGASITDQATGRKIFANKGAMKGILTHISETGELPRGRNAVYLTYSQINTDNVQQLALNVLAPRSVFLLDESHNAGGDESNTGLFFQEALANAKGVLFLSATWAKRPDNLPLYAAKTDISIAIPERWRVSDAVRAGGAPLQTVVSHQLAECGQLIRRERSFDGITVHNFIDERQQDQHEKISDQVTECLRAIVKADLEWHNVDFEKLRLRHKRVYKEKITHHKFTAIVHNIVKQFLLALKCDTAADHAIEAIERGEKPIIALESTMGAMLDAYVSEQRLGAGDDLSNLTWAVVLKRALDRTIHYKRKGERIGLGREALCEHTRMIYQDADKLLDALSIVLPVSPIDWMRHRITLAGHVVAEITGRSYRINYAGPVPVLAFIPPMEKTDRVRTGQLFNHGGIDALILNQAGSTGISLHASEKFKDQKTRHMIVAQPAGDINVFVQQLGRTNRTGQVMLPKYTLLSIAVPAEIRPAINLTKKLKSLNANTSSNTRSSLSIDAPDLMNKYGDKIVAEWLHDNPHIAEMMNLAIDKAPEEGGAPEEDLARTATGRAAMLPVKEQREFMETITESYSDYIAYLDETGQNDLEPKTYDFAAIEQTRRVIYAGSDESSPFGQDAIYGEYSIKRQGKPYTPAEVEQLVAATFGADMARLPHERDTLHSRLLSHDLEQLYVPYFAQLTAPHIIERATRIREHSRQLLNEYRVGTGLKVDLNGDIYNGIIYRIEGRKKVSGNPYTPSSLKFYIAVHGPLREVRVPGSQMSKITIANLGRNASPAVLCRDYIGDARQMVKLVTGNLLAAYGLLKTGSKGRIIAFTMQDGTTRQGILLSYKFDPEKDFLGQKQD